MKILKLRDNPKMAMASAKWFHSKWNVPLDDYIKSIDDCIRNRSGVPQWYVVAEGDEIIAGIGVIENDFHDRVDLTPNVCALYVDERYRKKGVAGQLLRCVSRDMSDFGIKTLYLVTEHTSFYERYGWQFLCMVKCDGAERCSRMYIYRECDRDMRE